MSEGFDPALFAHHLVKARDFRSPIALLSEQFPSVPAEEAYVVQVSAMAEMIRRNDPIIGAKVGVHQRRPVFSLYPRSSLMGAIEVADRSQLIDPMVQPVLVLRLFKEISGTDVSEAQIQDATESVVPGIEVVDYRVGPHDSLQHVDVVADNGGIAKVLVGEHGIDISHNADALKSLDCSFAVNGVETGPPADVITSPLAAVTALANHICAQGGKLEADWFIVVGPLRAPAPLGVGAKAELTVQNMAKLVMRAR